MHNPYMNGSQVNNQFLIFYLAAEISILDFKVYSHGYINIYLSQLENLLGLGREQRLSLTGSEKKNLSHHSTVHSHI